jgi:type IV fimbrial biogenesis protein FimT
LPPYIYLPVKQTMHLKQRGVTLLEMMMGISIIGLTMTFVVPSAHSIFTQNRIISEINRTSSLLQYARLHAVETKQTITVCPASNFSTCSNDWSASKIVFADINDNNIRDTTEPMLLSTETSELQNVMTGPNTAIQFFFTGSSATPATIKICNAGEEARFSRALFVSLQGRVTMSKDSDGDEVYETNAGTALDCE